MRSAHRFVEELNRRNVLRAGAAYIVIAWLAAQVADLLLETFAAPDWAMQFVVLALAIGLPVALVLSWAYELTTEGLVRTSEVNPEQSITKLTGRKIDFIIIGVLTVALIVFAVERVYWRGATSDSEWETLSIAVLPFDIASEEIAPFYAQLASDISRQLERRREVRLASTDAVAALPTGLDLTQTAARLGARFIVSGVFRLFESNIGLSISVYDADSEKVLSERNFANANLSEINVLVAEEVLRSLGLTEITVNTREVDPTAYRYYLEAKQEWAALDSRKDEIHSLLQKALEIEPQFAAAHALLCRRFVGEYRITDSLDAFRQAEQRCFRAWTLDKESPDVLFAMGNLYLHSGQKDKAVEALKAVLELNPNHYGAQLTLIESIRGDSPELAEAQYKRLISQHPGSPGAYASFQQHLFLIGRADEAIRYAEIAYQLRPNRSYAAVLSSDLLLAGQFDRAIVFLEDQIARGYGDSTLLGNLATSMFFQGDYAGAAELYLRVLGETPDSTSSQRNYGDAIWHLKGQNAAKTIYERVIQLGYEHLSINPENHFILADMVVAFGSIGDEKKFQQYVQEALNKHPKDPQMYYSIAVGASRLGDVQMTRQFANSALDEGYPAVLLNADPDIHAAGITY
jgi:adenylate cyclase